MTSSIGVFSILRSARSFAKIGVSRMFESNVEADCDQNNAQEERHAPAPGQERVAGNGAHCQYREVRDE